MARMTGDNEDAKRIDFLQAEIEKAIIPFRENTEAILVVGALMRVARILLRLYAPALRQGFVSACIAYLEGKTELGSTSGKKSSLEEMGFFIPPGSRN